MKKGSLIHLRMSVSSSATLRCADLRSLQFVSAANQRRFAGHTLVLLEHGMLQFPRDGSGCRLPDCGGKVGADLLGAQLADMQPRADFTDGGCAACRHLIGELFNRVRL